MVMDDFKVGNDAGWHLEFSSKAGDVLSIGSGDYDADIGATLPGGLDAGVYHFTIEGITNDHFSRLHRAWTNPSSPLKVGLYLYWRDTGSGLSKLANLAGLDDALDSAPSKDSLVAQLVVTRLSRRVGARRYEAVIEAREGVYDALTRKLDKQAAAAADPIAAALAVADRLGVAAISHPLAKDPPPPTVAPLAPGPGTSGVYSLGTLAARMTRHYGMAGRSMLLIRDGELHIGPGRAIPLKRAAPLALTDSGGLVLVEAHGIAKSDQADDDTPATIPPRLQVTVVLKGRPDLKPGDSVTVPRPIDDASTSPSSLLDALGGLGSALLGGTSQSGAPMLVYVSGVSHKLSRNEGFVTTLTGVEITDGREWDKVDATAADTSAGPDPEAGMESRFVSAVRSLISPHAKPLDVAEVRAATLQGDAEPPGQTIDVWLGAAAADGQPFGARRAPIERTAPTHVAAVPYVTPFAWGKCGLVLPRYPGTRVLVGHRGGDADDPVELGAIWESGHGPQSQAGDWWLILPAAVAANARQSLTDTQTASEPTGAATNDLIDADGARVIEVGRLTVRVQPGKLGAAGTRPAAPADANEHVTIEHESGSRIVIGSSGDITITAKGDMNFNVDKTLTIQADQVNVKVKSTMDVSGA